MQATAHSMLSELMCRSDADIVGSVSVLLSWSTGLPQNSVQVMVKDGWVTLSGNADLEFARRDLAASIRHVMGVVGISDAVVEGAADPALRGPR